MPYTRRSARVLQLDGADRILLFRSYLSVADPAAGFCWLTPGGGVSDGESLAEAAARELFEETGLAIPPVDLGPVVAVTSGYADLGVVKGTFHDSFFWYRTDRHDVDTAGFTELETSQITEHRWWPVASLASATEPIFPFGLVPLLEDLLAGRVPPSPCDCPGTTDRVSPWPVLGIRWYVTPKRARILAGAAIAAVLSGIGCAAGVYYVDSVPTPAQLDLPESTTVYFADGKTPMAKLGMENRTILAYADIVEVVKQSMVAAEDQTFWTNEGVDFRSVLRAAWNNVTGGRTQGASTITQQYARIAADLKGVTYSRKLREAVIAWKLSDTYSKEEILEFYLNTVPFGRGAYGIEAAAQAFFGKSANRHASSRLDVSEAMVLVSMVKQPEADPADPDGSPGYDPSRGPKALENSKARWAYVRDGMVKLGYLSTSDAAALVYPAVRKPDPGARQSGLDRPTGLAVNQVLSELRRLDEFRDKPADYLQNGGFRIVSTIDKRAQDAAEAATDIRRGTAPAAVRGQPANWQAALVAVEPGSGRVLAYYGGNDGAGADHAGWYIDESGAARGFGQHPPGSSFKVYDLAEAIRQKVSVKSRWDAPATKEFPASGRTRSSPAGPVRNASTASCQPSCTLWEATSASLNVVYFDLTERLGAGSIVDMARAAGVESIWDSAGRRIDLRSVSGRDAMARLSTEVGIGQYGISVLDHANGMATFAAGGKRSHAHFVRSVTKRGDDVYAESPTQTDVGLDKEQIAQLNWTLSRVDAAKLSNGWNAAGKTGTWQHGTSVSDNAHTWMVGYTKRLATAVWLGTTDGAALVTKSGGHDVFGATHPGPIWRQFMVEATAAMKLDRRGSAFDAPRFPGETSAPPVTRSPTTPRPAPTPTTPPPTPRPKPTPPPPTPPRPSASAAAVRP